MAKPYACPLSGAEHARNGRMGTLLGAPPFAESAIYRDRGALSGALAHSAAVLAHELATNARGSTDGYGRGRADTDRYRARLAQANGGS